MAASSAKLVRGCWVQSATVQPYSFCTSLRHQVLEWYGYSYWVLLRYRLGIAGIFAKPAFEGVGGNIITKKRNRMSASNTRRLLCLQN